jgi:arginine-tRNA-protein transferase
VNPISFTTPLAPCNYLPGRVAQLRYEVLPEMTSGDYMERLRAGWRRFGPIVFRPECPSCRMCQSLRVPVSSFRPTRSQGRAWKRNAGDVQIRVGAPSITPEKEALFEKFHQHGRETKGWPAGGGEVLDLFALNPFPTEEWTYLIGEQLVAVGYVDVMSEGLSAIYFYWDPADAHRSLGTFNVLSAIASARERGLPYVYLGYYVEGCRSLEYKGRFGPSEILRDGKGWEPFTR